MNIICRGEYIMDNYFIPQFQSIQRTQVITVSDMDVITHAVVASTSS